MKKKISDIWASLKLSGSDVGTYNITKLSAALAYYTVFALSPMLIVLISLVSIFYGKEAARGEIYGQIKSVVGSDAAASIQDIIGKAALSPSFTFASVIGVVVLLFTATGVFAEIQSSINLIWNLKIKPKKSGILKMLKIRLISFSLIISLGFIALVSLLINYLVDALSTRLEHLFSGKTETLYVGYIINFTITLLAISALFSIIFKFLPDAMIKWKDVRMGAVTTAILFMIGKFIIGLYLSKGKPGTAFGAAGSMIIILLWVYYSSIILYFGAAFTKNYAQVTGKNIYPNDYAVFIEQVEVENKSSLQDQSGKQIKDNETGEVKSK